jgi:hypothetical protein
MANIRIFEHRTLPNAVLILPGEHLAKQDVPIGAVSAQSTALNSETSMVHIQTDGICHIAFGTSPTATTSHHKLALGGSETFIVAPGSKVAVIQGT